MANTFGELVKDACSGFGFALSRAPGFSIFFSGFGDEAFKFISSLLCDLDLVAYEAFLVLIFAVFLLWIGFFSIHFISRSSPEIIIGFFGKEGKFCTVYFVVLLDF